jgi:2'-deoxynucleoside 5'-phosphate N-hydrolase
MKVMFVASIRGKQDYSQAYNTIVHTLEKNGTEVYHEHVTAHGQEDLNRFSSEEDVAFHNDILAKIRSCDVVIAECSYQSLSVGYLVSYAIEQSKPTIIFYDSTASKPNLFPTLSRSEKLLMTEYSSLERLPELVLEYLEYAKERVDVRFNFFISPTISAYLDKVSRLLKVPRSVYLRQLIEEDMQRRDKVAV